MVDVGLQGLARNATPSGGPVPSNWIHVSFTTYCRQTMWGALVFACALATIPTQADDSIGPALVSADAEEIATPHEGTVTKHSNGSTMRWHQGRWWMQRPDRTWLWWDGESWQTYGAVQQPQTTQQPTSFQPQLTQSRYLFSRPPRRFENGWDYPNGMNPSGGGWVGGFYSSGGGYGSSSFGYGYGVPSYGPWQNR